MGLDLVEIVMATEETFNIEFDDKIELGKINTVGEFYELILKKVKNIEKSECISNIIFYKLRKGILEITDLRRKDIKPSTTIEEIFNKKDILEEWINLEEKIKIKLPELVLKEELSNALTWMNLIFVFCIITLIIQLKVTIGISLILIDIIINIIANKLLKKKYLPKHIKTIADIVSGLTASEYRKKIEIEEQTSELGIWAVLVDIIVDQVGVESKHITKNATFLHDLGVQ